MSLTSIDRRLPAPFPPRALGLPKRQGVEQAVDHTLLAPQHQGVAIDTLAALAARAIMLEVDASHDSQRPYGLPRPHLLK